ncbi:hypothetical protein [Micromonospora globispora]|nr:hypothetical protein [Micromonospora globispora]RQX05942.1 hypothetical protein DKL51_01800 [Micromonospora globispora]
MAGNRGEVLDALTSRPTIADRLKRRMVVKALLRVSSRTRLAFLLGLPREFVADLPAEAFVAAFGRVAAADATVAEWLAALARDGRVDAMQREVDRLRTELSAAEGRAEAAERRVAELADRCDQLEEALRVEYAEATSVRAAQDRQLQIDTIRALADLAAEMEEIAANHLEPELLVERVRALVAAQALEPVGLAGAKVSFDPAQHDPIVGGPLAGAEVMVIRPGYRWHPTGGEILIHKALVSQA